MPMAPELITSLPLGPILIGLEKPVQIVRLLGRPGEANIGVATALAVMLLVLTVIIVSVAERIRPRRSGGW